MAIEGRESVPATEVEEQPQERDAGAAVLAALEQRRSAARMREESPPREAIERVLQAAVWAPNHYRTEPWRFVVIEGEGRNRLGEVMAESLVERLQTSEDEDDSPVEVTALVDKERRKPLRAPVVVAVASVASNRPKVQEIEEICAVAAGIQNMLLAAEALGLGAMWRTGAPARDMSVKRHLGFPDESHILGFIYIGYPDLVSQHERNRDFRPYTRWIGDEQDV